MAISGVGSSSSTLATLQKTLAKDTATLASDEAKKAAEDVVKADSARVQADQQAIAAAEAQQAQELAKTDDTGKSKKQAAADAGLPGSFTLSSKEDLAGAAKAEPGTTDVLL